MNTKSLNLIVFFILIIVCIQCASATSYDIILGGSNTKSYIWNHLVVVKNYGDYYEYDFGNNVDEVGWQIYIPELKDHDVSVYVTVEKSGRGIADLAYNQDEHPLLSIMPLKTGDLIELPNGKITYRLDFKRGKPYIILLIISEGRGDVTVKLYKDIHVYVYEEESTPIQKPKPITTPKISIKITDVIGYIVVGSALAIGILVGMKRW